MADTPNHEYNVRDQGDQDWHQPLNENFEEFEVDIELLEVLVERLMPVLISLVGNVVLVVWCVCHA